MARLPSAYELDWRGALLNPRGESICYVGSDLHTRRRPHGEVGVLLDAYRDAGMAPSVGACGSLWDHLNRSLKDTIGSNVSSNVLKELREACVFAGLSESEGISMSLCVRQISLNVYNAGLWMRIGILRRSWQASAAGGVQ